MPTQCLASTGSNLLAVLGIGFVLADFGNSLVSALSDAWDTFTSWF